MTQVGVTAVGAGPAPPPARLHPADVVRIGSVGLRARRLRAALSTLGIAIGIAAMVAVLGISDSSRSQLLAQLDRLGTNLLTVEPGQTLSGGAATLPEESVAMIGRISPVESTSSVGTVAAHVRRTDRIPEEETGGISVRVADTDLARTLGATVAAGRFHDDASSSLPTVVLGSTAAERLGIDRADGSVAVWLGDRWFTVVGILDPVELAPELDSAALIGREVAAELFDWDGSPSTVYVRVRTDAVVDVQGVLGATANPEHPEEVQVSRPSDALAARAAADDAFTTLLLALGGVALLVGGVGIANVMVVSVLERRGEIGLRRALGATRRHIRVQFLTEALLLSAAGGVAGVLLGSVVTAAYAHVRGWEAVVPPIALGGGVVAAVAIGALAGLYPAARAARLAPTEALRTV